MSKHMLKPGDTYTKEIVFRQEDVETFASITGDHNPIHTNVQYAANTSFKQPVVHGMFAASAFSGVLGMTFPGKGSIALYRELTFIRPVFVDQTYSMHFKIIEIDYQKHQGLIKSTLKNKKGQVCIKAISRILNKNAFCYGDHEKS